MHIGCEIKALRNFNKMYSIKAHGLTETDMILMPGQTT